MTSEGWTPLQLAIKKNNLNIFKKLVATKGININQTTGKGTALHLAVQMNLLDFVKVLIENKVDDTLKDNSNRTAL